EGVLSGIVAVRHDLFRRLRAASPPHPGDRRVRAGVGAAPALDDGLQLTRAPRRGDLPVQGPALAKAGDGMRPSEFFHRNVVLSFQEDAIGVAYAASWITVRVWITTTVYSAAERRDDASEIV